MIPLLAALAAPAAGALLYRALHGRARLRRMVDRFVYVAVPLLVAAQILPHALEDRALPIVLAVVGGLLVPTLFERASRALAHRTDALGLVVGLSGLTVHSLLEGAAFAPLSTPVDTTFAWAVILHRVPVGLVVWWLVRPRYGVGPAVAGIGLLVGTTLLGFLIGNEVLNPVHGPGFELYQAFVSGTLVHVVFHQGKHDHTHDHDHHHADGRHDHLVGPAHEHPGSREEGRTGAD